MVSILIVDDDPLVRLGLRLLFESTRGLRIVAEASNGVETLTLLSQIPVDAVLMDVNMERMGGLEATHSIRQRFPQIRVILMSAYSDEGFQQHALNAGAFAFVPKTAPTEVLLAALQPDESPRAQPQSAGTDSMSLSTREKQVAARIIAGWRNDEIADALFLSPNSVKTYVSRIYKKLQVSNRVQLANAIRDGRLVTDDPHIGT